MLRIYMICHDDMSHTQASAYERQYDWIRVIRIPNTKWMESAVFEILCQPEYRADWSREEIQYVGLLKYNFQEKSPFYDFPALCHAESANWDVWTFVNGHEDNYQLPNPSMITYAGICHTLFPVIWYLLFHGQVPIERLFSPAIPAFYSNSWIAKKSLVEPLLTFVAQAVERMETTEPLRTLLHYNANYLQRLPTERLQEIMSFPYYTYHCFVMERIPCLYFWQSGARIRPVGGPHRRLASQSEPGIPLLSSPPPI